MDIQTIAARRLAAQRLIGDTLPGAEAVVRHFMCVQSQDYPAAKWAIAQRAPGVTNDDIDALYDQGKILRLHMLRPTWHFVHAQDIRWILKLTSPRAHQVSSYYYRKLGMTHEIIAKSEAVFKKALRGNTFLTRQELKKVLETAGVDASDLRLTYLVMHAEHEAILCSGPRRGKQHTLALLDERVPEYGRKLDGDEALATFVYQYFAAHGPAQIADLTWWASLTAAQIKEGITLNGSKLQSTVCGGKTYYFVSGDEPKITGTTVHLLPNYDELSVAFKDHTASMDPTRIANADPSKREFIFYYHFVTANGLAVAGWKVEGSTITLRTLAPLTKTKLAGIAKQAAAYSKFIGKPLQVIAG
jgi:hypothetical protein